MKCDIHREIRIMRRCRNHRHIVNIVDYDLDIRHFDYGSVYMQQGELGSVDALIDRYRSRRQYLPDEGFAWKVLYDVAIGIAYLWTGQDEATVRTCAALGEVVPRKSGWTRIIHRDLKPSNVFMTWRNKPTDPPNPHPVMMIGDFGSAVSTDDVINEVVPPTDHRFASPEFPECGKYSDVWSTALIIVCIGWTRQEPPTDSEYLTGWESKSMHKVLKKCFHRDQDIRPDPAELPKYVWRGWQTWIGGRTKDVERLPDWAFGG